MRTLAFIGVIFLVGCVSGNDRTSKSFTEDLANITDSLVLSQENLSNANALSIKIDAFYQVSQMHGINTRTYQSIYNVLDNLWRFGTQMITSKNILEEVVAIQDKFDEIFDELNIQRDVDETELPSKINELMDEFVNRYTETSVELFDNMFTQGKNLEDEVEKLAADSDAMVDILAGKIQTCLDIPKTKYKEVFQCHQNTRTILPPLAHNSAMIEIIYNELQQLHYLQLDGKTSIYQLLKDMSYEKSNLLRHIQEVKDQREAEKENQNSNDSE